jgi:hypothetical protein
VTSEYNAKAGLSPITRKAKAVGKLPKQESDQILKAIQLQKVIMKLWMDLQCQHCKTLCYVDKRTGKHIHCSHEMITKWGKLFVCILMLQLRIFLLKQ